MKFVDLTTFLVKSIIKHEELLQVEVEIEKDDFIQLGIKVAEKDMGRIIGKDGKVANAIRTIIQASGFINGNKKIKINIDAIK